MHEVEIEQRLACFRFLIKARMKRALHPNHARSEANCDRGSTPLPGFGGPVADRGCFVLPVGGHRRLQISMRWCPLLMAENGRILVRN